MKKRNTKVTNKVKTGAGIMRNQFFGMLLLAIGIGALVVLVRYVVVATQMPLDVYEITPTMLIPGQQ